MTESPPNEASTPSARAAFVGYVVLSVAMTWPLAAHLGDRLAGGNNDLFQNYWNFWWWQTSLENGESPYSTELLFAGSETSLAFHTHSEGNLVWTAPFLLAFGPAVALNLATLGGFVLAGFGAFLLARELFADARAAFLAGVVFAFFPQHFEQSLEHLNLSSYGAMPLFLLYLVRGTRTGSWRAWMLAAVFFAINSLFSWHNGLMILPGAILLFVFEIWRTEERRLTVLGRACVAGVVAVALVLPFAWPMVSEMAAGETYFNKDVVHKPIDPFFLTVPSSQHPLWGSLTDRLYVEYRSYRSVGFTAYVGFIAVLIVSSAAVRSWRRRRTTLPRDSEDLGSVRQRLVPWVWLTIFVLYVVLSLGSELRYRKVDYELTLPFAVLMELPILSTLRVANRFLVPAMIGLSILVAWGSRLWLRDSPRPRIVASVLFALLVLDFLWLPFPMRELPQPEWVDRLGDAPPGVVLNVPGGHRARAADDMYLQTLHGRTIVGGYVSCSPPQVAEMLEDYPFLQTILEAEASPSYRDLPADPGLGEVLEGLDVAVVVVHKHRSREWLTARRAAVDDPLEKRYFNPEKGLRSTKIAEVALELRKLWGEPYHVDENVEIFRRP